MSTIPSVNVKGFQSANGVVGTYEQTNGPSATLWQTAPILEALQDPKGYSLFRDDYFNADTTFNYALVTDSGGSATSTDATGGICTISTAGADNDESYLSTYAENWKFAASKPMWFEAYVAGVGSHNFIVGVSDTVGANFLLDTEAGPAASYDGAVFFVDGGSVWKFETSNAGTQVTNTSLGAYATTVGVRLGFIFDPNDGTTGKITPYFNGVAGTTHDITLSGLEEMHIVVGAKAKTAAAAVINIDYVQALQVR